MSDLGRRLEGLSPERRRLVEQRLAGRLEGRDRLEPIAVIGLACRFPGAESAEAFWQLLREGGDAIQPVPSDRWDSEAWQRQGETSGVRMPGQGGFLRSVDAFDAAFFEISPREAEAIDPQQRLLLEIAWRAFEHAGVPLDSLRGSETGVFVGAHSHSTDYARLTFDQPDTIGPFVATGTAQNFLAGRLSYFFDLRGPSLVVDTACSSSLVAVHLACQSLRAGECRSALAAGVNLILTPHFSLAAAHMQMLAPDGRCKPFDARADGFGRGEGCGAVLLKLAAAARADGDRILAVIRGSAINQDGQTNGITAPNGRAQQVVIERALANAGVTPEQISYVEAHGTGTPLGDPIEAEALVNALNANRPAGARCWIGSAKANVGHLEGAAGVAGLIKTVLGLTHCTIPPLAQFSRLSPHVSTGGLLAFPTAATPWPIGNHRRIAGVSSFGWSGTNAHVIVEEAPTPVAAAEPPAPAGPQILPLSARNPPALRTLAQAYADRLANMPSATDFVWSSAARRTHFEHRIAVVGDTAATLRSRLDQFVSMGSAPFVVSSVARHEAAGLAFVFPGQGSQWPAMGEELYATDGAFREAIDACDAAARPFVSWSFADAIRRPAPGRSDTIDVVQPLLFAMAVGLAARWRAWGIEPDAVVGHSMGEIAAAHVAGALTLEDAARIICVRSTLLTRVSGRGRMAVVDLAAAEVAAQLDGSGVRLVIAAHNSPHKTVIAGDSDAIAAMVERFTAADVFCRAIRVDVASHCALVDPLLDPLRAALRSIQPRAAHTTIYSTVTGAPVAGETLDGDYWVRNLRAPVLLSEAVARLATDGHRRFVEISPHPILRDAVAESCVGERGRVVVLGSLERDRPARETLAANLASLFVDGLEIDWRRVTAPGRAIDLPLYPWSRQRYWIQSVRPPAWANPAAAGASSERDEAQRDASRCLFELSWDDASPPPVGAHAGAGRWLVAGPTGDHDRLRAALASRGCAATATSLDCLTTVDEWTKAAVACDADAVVFVVPPACPDLTTPWPEIERRLLDTADNLIAAAKGLASAKRPVRLWIVTRNAQPVDLDPPSINPIATALAGLARVVWEEQPDLAGGVVDIDTDLENDESARRLAAHLLTGPARQTALRGNRRLVPHFSRFGESATAPLTLRGDASYLITGGLGGVGLAVARRLVDRGARYLVLVGRRGLSDYTGQDERLRHSAVGALRARGARVLTLTLDIGDGAAVAATLAAIEQKVPLVRGVVHAAATIEDSLVENTTRTNVAGVLRAKAAGAWHLQQYFAGRPLDFLVWCSSLGSLLGLTGQASYALANAFVDGLAHRLRDAGSAMSINWGGWRETGFATGSGGRATIAELERDGIGGIAPDRALDVFERLVSAHVTQAAVWLPDFDALARSRRVAADPDLFAKLAPAPVIADERQHSGAWRERLTTATPAARRALLRDTVRRELADLLRLPPETIDTQQPVGRLGLESLMALELHRRIECGLGEMLPKTVVWRYATVDALSEYLLSRLFSTEPDSAHSDDRGATPVLDAITEEAALAALLESRPER
jgi:acyl transferase domain-containing protein